MHISSLLVAALATIPFTTASDTSKVAWEVSLFSGDKCGGSLKDSYIFYEAQNCEGTIPPPPTARGIERSIKKRRLQPRDNYECVKLDGIKSWSGIPEEGDVSDGWTLYLVGYKSDDCSGESDKSFSTAKEACVDFSADGGGEITSVKIFISTCGNPFG